MSNAIEVNPEFVHGELGHEFIHDQMNEIIANGVMSQYSPSIKSFMEEERCPRCCNLIIDNYPAVELWMRWNGFNEFEEYVFIKAVRLAHPQDVFDEYGRSFQHWPLLFRAVSNYHLSFVKEIIERCPKVLEHVCDNDNVFSFALILGRNEIVNYLLELLTDESEYSKYLKLGQLEFVTACNRSECGLETIKKLLDVVMTGKEVGWKTGLFRGVQMMIFKHLEDLPGLLAYFCQTYSSETGILYEQTEKGDVLLFSIAIDQPSVSMILENVEEAVVTKDRDDKTLLMRAVEVQNLELVQLLISKYKININEKTNSDRTALSYAICQGNPFTIKYLLENGAKIYASINADEKIESHVIRCDAEEIINFAISAVEGSISIEIFSNVLKCLYEASPGSRWPWFRGEHTRKLFFPSSTNDKGRDTEMIRRFSEIYKILHKLKITEKCLNVFDTILLDSDVSFEQKQFAVQPGGLLQFQMSLMLEDPALEYPCSEMYETKEFELIKDYLRIDSFNEVAEGREIPLLKRYCREVIRQQIIDRLVKQKLHESDGFHLVFADLFEALPLPQQLINFLRYQN